MLPIGIFIPKTTNTSLKETCIFINQFKPTVHSVYFL